MLSEHGDACARPKHITALAHSRPDWLVDVDLGCIVPCPSHCYVQYIALSYTWGQSRTLKLTKSVIAELMQPGILRSGSIAKKIPRTIQDAIGVTKSLKQRFLWVDSLCIVQDDPSSLDRNIKNVPSIYAYAHVCIIAEAGENAEFGLRGIEGVSQPRDSGQSIFTLGGGEMLATNSLADNTILDEKASSYHQRAWTFQEWLFARRRLIFGPGPVRWLCQCREWREDLVPEIAVSRSYQYDIRSKRLSDGFFGFPKLSDLKSLITFFSKRQLTCPQDAYRAFEGIQTVLHRVYPGGLLFGLPEVFFEIALCWSVAFEPWQAILSDRFPKPLLDEGCSPGGLPSWSWTSWHGGINFPHDYCSGDSGHKGGSAFYGAATKPATEWFAMDSPNSSSRRSIRSL